MSSLLNQNFIVGYKHHAEQEDVYWLSNHPESVDLIFSKDKATAFVFDDELEALTAIKQILMAENHSWYTTVVEKLQAEPLRTPLENKMMTLAQAEAKINEFLKLYNERSNSRLELYLTLNKKDNSIRGYGNSRKIGDAITNFVALLAIKGMKAQCLNSHTFEVKIDT
jgi:hypothetical protein